jgi:galactonate dehydratase
MNRRTFLTRSLGACALTSAAAYADLPKTKITRVRYYKAPTDAAGRPNTKQPLFNQSTNSVVIETDSGLTGIGEGGAHDTVEQCAGMLIGENPFQIDRLWQLMYRGYFYPAGREKLHALGALDLALWDIKGKALGVPVYELIGGLARDHVECYSTAFPSVGDVKESARACVEMGFRAYRTGVTGKGTFDRFEEVRATFEQCKQIREGVGKDGGWCIDYHTRLDMADAVALSDLIEPLKPYFVEDLVRSEYPGAYRTLRGKVKVPIAVGEQFGDKWNWNELIENDLIDHARVTIPNVGGLTEFLKIAHMCETHYVGLVPHFTGPVSEAAMVHACCAFSGTALMEMLGKGDRQWPYIKQAYDFKQGKLWPNRRPGLGVEIDTSKLQQIADVQERYVPLEILKRPDGSFTNW